MPQVMLRRVFALFLTFLVIAVPAIQAQEVPLLTDYGMDLAPGYRYTIGMEAHRALWEGTRAEVSAGPLYISLINEDNNEVRLIVKVNGEERYNNVITGTESVTLTIYVDYDGSGTIEASGIGRICTFYIDHAYRIYVHEETVEHLWYSASSVVEISRQRLPSEGDYTQPIGETNTGSSSMLSTILDALGAGAVVAVVIILVLLGLVVVLIVISQATRRGLINMPKWGGK